MAVAVSGIIPVGTIVRAEAATLETAGTEIVTVEMTGTEIATATTTAMEMIPDLNRDLMQDRSAAGRIAAVNRKHDL